MKKYTIAILAMAPFMATAQVIDGTADASYGKPVWVQNIGTGFGDSNLGQVDVANGSELDAVYVKQTDAYLYLVFAGNLESNYNHIAIFIDTGAGGFNVLPGDNAYTGDYGFFNGLAGITFDANFNANYGIELRNGGSPNTLYVDMAQLGANANPNGIINADNDDGGGNSGVIRHIIDANGFELALNNSNVLGVDGNSGAAESGAGVRTGAELKIPFALLGLPSSKVLRGSQTLRIAGFISGGNYLSNQVVGGLPVGTNNLANPPIDFTQFAGQQFLNLGFTISTGTATHH